MSQLDLVLTLVQVFGTGAVRFERTDLLTQVYGFADRRDKPLRHAPVFLLLFKFLQ